MGKWLGKLVAWLVAHPEVIQVIVDAAKAHEEKK